MTSVRQGQKKKKWSMVLEGNGKRVNKKYMKEN